MKHYKENGTSSSEPHKRNTNFGTPYSPDTLAVVGMWTKIIKDSPTEFVSKKRSGARSVALNIRP